MLPWWNKEVTVYHRKETIDDSGKTVTKWEIEHCTNCFFKEKTQQVLQNKILVNKSVKFVRLPMSIMSLSKGDIAVIGIVYDKITDNASGNDILKKYGDQAFVINTAQNNESSCLGLSHRFGSE